jgi:hypothetical protein
MAPLRATASAARSVLGGREHGGALGCVGSRSSNSPAIKKREQKNIKKQDHAQHGARGIDRTRLSSGMEALALSPRMGDFNEDLRAFGLSALRATFRIQLAPQDVVRFMRWGNGQGGVTDGG